jgi:hypothetical protein
MRNLTTLVIGLLMAASLWAQTTASQACALLSTNDLTAIGATGPGQPAELPMTTGTKGETAKMCSWKMAAGGLHLSIGKVGPGLTVDSVMAALNKPYAALLTQGWTEQKKDFGSTKCSLLTPPAGGKNNPTTTSCLTVAKGMMVTAATLSKTPVPIEKIKTLVDSAVARVP